MQKKIKCLKIISILSYIELKPLSSFANTPGICRAQWLMWSISNLVYYFSVFILGASMLIRWKSIPLVQITLQLPYFALAAHDPWRLTNRVSSPNNEPFKALLKCHKPTFCSIPSYYSTNKQSYEAGFIYAKVYCFDLLLYTASRSIS